jgi:hypothetical protein
MQQYPFPKNFVNKKGHVDSFTRSLGWTAEANVRAVSLSPSTWRSREEKVEQCMHQRKTNRSITIVKSSILQNLI